MSSVPYPASLLAVGGARTGIAPVNLLDVQDVNGNLYFWADRLCNAPIAISGEIDVNATPPVAPAAGQYVAWSFARTATPIVGNTDAGSVTDLTDQTATITQTKSAPIGGTHENVVWRNFQMPSLPAGAVIDAMYPVAVMAGVGTGAINSSSFAIPGSGEFEGQYNAGSIGTTLAELEALSLNVSIASSITEPPFLQQIVVSFIGVAVYYHLGTSGGLGSGIENSGASAPYKPWLLSVPSFTFHRSLVTDIGSFTIQNISGDTLSRDMEKLLRASALEGAFFIYRLWQPDAQAAWLEVHGQLTVEDDGVDTITLKGEQLINASQDDTPLEQYCETCQLQWAGKRCGSTQATECEYSFQTCQVIERPMIIMNDFEKNYGEATANVTANRVINRRRRI